MKAVIFSGPTLSGDPVNRARDFVWRPPAKDGDVYKCARENPPAIGIIDGVFEIAPSIWHKEILWALSRGIHVFGAASMGALRASELGQFGMRGIGKVFSDFESNVLQDDDEVTVLHAGAEAGFRPLSDAMVDIRATLAKAAASEVISQRTSAYLVRCGKSLFFKERRWPRLLRMGANTPLRKKEISTLSAWLPHNRVEQKRDDGRAMVEAMRNLLQSGAEPFRADFEFQHTCFWRQFVRTQARLRPPLPFREVG